jgi:hypothetical protein
VRLDLGEISVEKTSGIRIKINFIFTNKSCSTPLLKLMHDWPETGLDFGPASPFAALVGWRKTIQDFRGVFLVHFSTI